MAVGRLKTTTSATHSDLVLLEQHDASSSATLDFTSFISGAYDEYVFEFVNLIPATNTVTLLMRMGTGAGPTYDSGANYDSAGLYVYATSSGVTASTGTGQSAINIIDSIGNQGNYGASGSVRLLNPGSSSLHKVVVGQVVIQHASVGMLNVPVSGIYKSNTALTGVRFLMSSGNITSGTIRVYGISKSAGVAAYVSSGVVGGFAPLNSSLKIPNTYLSGTGGADALPPSPSSFDDEFNTTSTLSGTIGTFTANNTTDAPGGLHLSKSATGAFTVYSAYKTAPSTPFTVTCKLAWYLLSANFQQYGLLLADSTPTALYVMGPTYQSSTGIPEIVYGKWTNSTTRGTITEFTGSHHGLKYLRMVCNSSTSVDLYFSIDGSLWLPLALAQNPGFTIAKAGLFITGNDNNVAADAYFEWIRFS